MCQEVHVADIRTALQDYCEEDDFVECTQVEDLLAELQTPIEHNVGTRGRTPRWSDGRDVRAK
jgi:hypothetical protein